MVGILQDGGFFRMVGILRMEGLQDGGFSRMVWENRGDFVAGEVGADVPQQGCSGRRGF